MQGKHIMIINFPKKYIVDFVVAPFSISICISTSITKKLMQKPMLSRENSVEAKYFKFL